MDVRAPGVNAGTPAAGADRPKRQEETRGIRVANIKSQIKRVKTNEKRRQRNKSVKSAVRTAVRRFREAAETGDVEKAAELQRAAAKALDKAASKGVITRTRPPTASRRWPSGPTRSPPDSSSSHDGVAHSRGAAPSCCV
jgi:small subunit ribosomal protein S20